ncbi:MAG: hypothetical protein S4CHLAM7_07140 [Chlamydiae bacterium]|nr:hypothetical protein [Chlamydiota bacterium]
MFEPGLEYEVNNRVLSLFQLWRKFFFTYVPAVPVSRYSRFKISFFKKILKYQKYHKQSYNLILDNDYHVISKCISNRAMELNNIYRKPLLKLDPTSNFKGKQILQKWGIKKNDWFILFHNRENTFMSSFQGAPYAYEKLYEHRNDSAENYYKTLKFITDSGGWCIRFGHYHKELPHLFSDRVIDYPFTDYHSSEMDLFLMQECKFYLGANSGPAQTAGYFGTPVVQVNGTPFIGFPYFHFDIGLPKLYYSEIENRLLSFKEIVANKLLLNSNDINDFKKAGIKLISNTQEEIYEASKEMLNRLEGLEKDSLEDIERQKSFMSIFSPNDYCYKYPGKVGKHFLKRHAELLINPHINGTVLK